jgi:ABC-type uncharacterized transport system substrate-binding protein
VLGLLGALVLIAGGVWSHSVWIGVIAVYEFIEHNELELACDTLEEAAKDRAVSSEFWLALCDAAKKMQLDDHATRYQKLAKKP